MPEEIVQILERALNPTERQHLLSLYYRLGRTAALAKGLWLNKSRSPEGRAAWQAYNSPRKKAKNARRRAREQERRAAADAVLQAAIAAARNIPGTTA